jgi:ribosomal protein L37E
MSRHKLYSKWSTGSVSSFIIPRCERCGKFMKTTRRKWCELCAVIMRNLRNNKWNKEHPKFNNCVYCGKRTRYPHIKCKSCAMKEIRRNKKW